MLQAVLVEHAPTMDKAIDENSQHGLGLKVSSSRSAKADSQDKRADTTR